MYRSNVSTPLYRRSRLLPHPRSVAVRTICGVFSEISFFFRTEKSSTMWSKRVRAHFSKKKIHRTLIACFLRYDEFIFWISNRFQIVVVTLRNIIGGSCYILWLFLVRYAIRLLKFQTLRYKIGLLRIQVRSLEIICVLRWKIVSRRTWYVGIFHALLEMITIYNPYYNNYYYWYYNILWRLWAFSTNRSSFRVYLLNLTPIVIPAPRFRSLNVITLQTLCILAYARIIIIIIYIGVWLDV